MSYPQQGGYQQQPGGYPQQGGYPPQGYPQQQPGGYPPQGGYSPYPQPPRKNNTPLIVGVGIAVVAVIVAVVLAVTLSGGDDENSDTANDSGTGPGGNPEVTIPGPNAPRGNSNDSGDSSQDGGEDTGGSSGGSSSARALAEATVKIIEEQDVALVDRLACDSSAASGLKRELAKLEGATVSATLGGVQESGSTAQARISLRINGQTQTITLEMAKKSGKWCAAGL